VRERHDATPYLPPERDLEILRAASARCRGCPLWQVGTQTVFGEGSRSARIVLVGEQPGDKEDEQGLPFVGPAGRVLDDALEAAGIPRGEAYITNAVKHFKWTAARKRRLHAKPSAREVKACRPWLESELAVVKPLAVVCMGATAAQALLGASFHLTQHRGEFIEDTGWALWVLATMHPSAVLRMPDDESRRRAMDEFAEDVMLVAQKIHG
jgi:uracil-DNA glycosylase